MVIVEFDDQVLLLRQAADRRQPRHLHRAEEVGRGQRDRPHRAQFAAAAPLAPRWGRLHLKWGEALAKLGRADEARAMGERGRRFVERWASPAAVAAAYESLFAELVDRRRES